MAARKNSEVTAVLLLCVGQHVHDFDCDGLFACSDPGHAERFTTICVCVPGEFFRRWADNSLSHTQHDVVTHQTHQVVEGWSTVDQVDELWTVFQQFSAVHKSTRVEVFCMIANRIVSDIESRVIVWLVARQASDPVEFSIIKFDLCFVQDTFKDQVAISMELSFPGCVEIEHPASLAVFRSFFGVHSSNYGP